MMLHALFGAGWLLHLMWCGAFALSLVAGMLTPLGPAGGALTTQCGITLTLAGAVPMEYLDAHRLDLCSVYGLLVARRFNGVHPRCHPRARQQLPNHRPAGLMDAGLPSLDGIMELDVPTLRHVPHVARGAWAQCLARAASAAAVSNTVPAWQELLMLPKAVLVAPIRGGARHHQQAALATLRRYQRWRAGEGMDLWKELRARPMATRSTADSTTATQHSRCCALAAEGELSHACAALTEPAPLPPSQATFEQLSAHHPQSAMPDVSRLGPPRPAAVPELSSEAVTHEACRSLDGRYTPDWPSSVQAAAAFDAAVFASDRFHGVHQSRQQTLSAALDKAQLAQLQVSAEGESERAHLQLLQ